MIANLQRNHFTAQSCKRGLHSGLCDRVLREDHINCPSKQAFSLQWQVDTAAQISEHKVQLGRCSYRSIWTIVVDNVTLLNKNGSHLMFKCTEDTNLKAAALQMCSTASWTDRDASLHFILQVLLSVHGKLIATSKSRCYVCRKSMIIGHKM